MALNISEETLRIIVDQVVAKVPPQLARTLFEVLSGIRALSSIPPTLDHSLRKIQFAMLNGFQFIACYAPLDPKLLDRVKLYYSLRCPKLNCLNSDDLRRVANGSYPLDSAFYYFITDEISIAAAQSLLDDRDTTKEFTCVEVYGGEIVMIQPPIIRNLILSAARISDPNSIGRDLCNEMHLAIVGEEIQGCSAITKGFRYCVTCDSTPEILLRELVKYYARDSNMSMTYEASQEWKRIIMEQLLMDKTDLNTIVHMNKIASYYRRMTVFCMTQTCIRMYYEILRLLSDKTFKHHLGDYCSFPIEHPDHFFINCPIIANKMTDIMRNYAVRHYMFSLVPKLDSFCRDHVLVVTCRVTGKDTCFEGLLWQIANNLCRFLSEKMMGPRRLAIYESLSPHFPLDIVNRIVHMAVLQHGDHLYDDKPVPFPSTCLSETPTEDLCNYVSFYFEHSQTKRYLNVSYEALTHYSYTGDEKDWSIDGHQHMDVFMSRDGLNWVPIKEEGQKSTRVSYIVRYPSDCDLNLTRFMPSTHQVWNSGRFRKRLSCLCPFVDVVCNDGVWTVSSSLFPLFTFSHKDKNVCIMYATANVHMCGDLANMVAVYLSTFIYTYEFINPSSTLPCSEWFIASRDRQPQYVIGMDICLATNPFMSGYENSKCIESTALEVLFVSELYWDGSNYSVYYRDVSNLLSRF